MPKHSLIALTLAAALPLSACGYSVFDAAEDIEGSGFEGGKPITTSFQTTAAFTAIEASGPDNIVLVTGDSFSIKAEGNAEAIKTLRFKIVDGTVEIGRTKGKWWGDSAKSATITITAPKISSVSLSGSGNFNGDRLSGDKVAFDLAGSGNLTVADVQSPMMEGSIAGSGDVKLAGKAAKADWSVAGSGDIDAASLISDTAEVSIAGSGNVRLNVSQSVDASIAGSGNVQVSGGAKCTKSIIGSGSLNCG
jgi:Putative auto-transporter adhesin, head GIN domain